MVEQTWWSGNSGTVMYGGTVIVEHSWWNNNGGTVMVEQ